MALKIEPLDQYVEWVLNSTSRFQRKLGLQKVPDPNNPGRRKTKVQYREEYLWFRDQFNNAHVLDGLRPRIVKSLQAAGYDVEMSVEPSVLPAFQPDLSWIKHEDAKLRGGQVRMLSKILTHERCQLKGITALGKTYLIQRLCRCFNNPDTRIVICTPGVGLVDAYARGLRSYLGPAARGTIGVCKGGSGFMTQRIIISTPESLGRIPAESIYMLLFDEVHKAGAFETIKRLTKFMWARMYGLSASPDGRTDGGNRAIEAVFGPIVENVTYREGVEEGYIPDVDTRFYLAPMSNISTTETLQQEQALIIHNVTRNRLIRDVCLHWDHKFRQEDNGAEPQIIIVVDKAEHAVVLRRLLPDYTAIFKSIKPGPKKRLLDEGYLPEEMVPVSEREALKLQQGLELGLIRKAIIISSMGTGVDTKKLDVIVRADGGKSPVSITQYRGRVMRGHRGVYIDFMDQGFPRYERAAMARYRDALKIGMKVQVQNFYTGEQVAIASGVRRAVLHSSQAQELDVDHWEDA